MCKEKAQKKLWKRNSSDLLNLYCRSVLTRRKWCPWKVPSQIIVSSSSVRNRSVSFYPIQLSLEIFHLKGNIYFFRRTKLQLKQRVLFLLFLGLFKELKNQFEGQPEQLQVLSKLQKFIPLQDRLKHISCQGRVGVRTELLTRTSLELTDTTWKHASFPLLG